MRGSSSHACNYSCFKFVEVMVHKAHLIIWPMFLLLAYWIKEKGSYIIWKYGLIHKTVLLSHHLQRFVWLCRASGVPDLQGPLTFLKSNLAGNARTLLMLLFLSTHCITRTLLTAFDFMYLWRKKHPGCIMHSVAEMDSLGCDYHVQEVIVIYDMGSPSV